MIYQMACFHKKISKAMKIFWRSINRTLPILHYEVGKLIFLIPILKSEIAKFQINCNRVHFLLSDSLKNKYFHISYWSPFQVLTDHCCLVTWNLTCNHLVQCTRYKAGLMNFCFLIYFVPNLAHLKEEFF